MTIARRRSWSGIVVATLLVGAPAFAADPATICRATKMLRAGLYDLCLLKATAGAARSGGVPDVAKCDLKFLSTWAKTEAKAAGTCPTTGDETTIAGQVQGDVAAIVAALTPTSSTTSTTLPSGPPCGGGIYPGCGGSCSAGLSCWANVTAGPTQECSCLPAVATPCASTGGPVTAGATCGGACPAGQVCSTLRIDDSTLVATCGCIPAGSTPCISSSQPTCGGACPGGSTCAADPLGLFSCVCQ
jgi:hypothetical protein